MCVWLQLLYYNLLMNEAVNSSWTINSVNIPQNPFLFQSKRTLQK